MNKESTFSECEFLHLAFGKIAALYPDNIAVVDAGDHTYRELDDRSSRVAAALLARPNFDGGNVGIYLDRGIDMIAAILGVLKANATYVPLDPTFPAERLNYLVADSEIAFIVSRSDMQDRLSDVTSEIVDVDAPVAPGAESFARQQDARANRPAYMIYTSGSTGRPKGVMVSHHNVLRLMDSTAPVFNFKQNDVWTLFHSIGFDFSVWEMWGPLLTGAKLVVVPYEISRSPEDFYSLLRRSETTFLNLTASAFRHLLPVCLKQGALPALRMIVFGGEKLEMAMLRPWVATFGAQRTALVNMYGITEATVHATYKRLSVDDVMKRVDSPIGVPLSDLRLHILDEQRAPVAAGQAGEMYIEGDGVALGYYRRPDLTAERFVELNLPDGGTAHAYRTGDLVIRSDDGELVYLQRADGQLKVRGFRVEPQEIEACLNKHADLLSSVVTVFDFGNGDERLVAFYVVRSGVPHNAAKLVSQLRATANRELPAHMRPSEFARIDALPINVNGKLDRKLLIKPEKNMQSTSNTQFDLLAKVYQIVTQTIELDSMGKDDDFFDIGGTSLTLLRVLARINQQFGVKINMSLLADGVSIASLVDAIQQQEQL
jgi:syringomycin synthetase protein SyrB1